MSWFGAVVFMSRLVIVLTLTPAVAAKLGHSKRVSGSLEKWRIVPAGSHVTAAYVVIWLELFMLLAISAGVGARYAGLVGVVLFTGIAVAAWSVVSRGIATTCTCFSLEGTERVTVVTVVRAMILAVLAGVVALGSGWTITPGLGWSPILVVLTIPLWIGLARRTLNASRLRASAAT